MAAPTRRIKVAPGSELAQLLEDAGHEPVLLEQDGTLYRLQRLEPEFNQDWKGYDAETIRAALDTYGGSWRGVDAEALKALIYRAREEGSRPPDRP